MFLVKNIGRAVIKFSIASIFDSLYLLLYDYQANKSISFVKKCLLFYALLISCDIQQFFDQSFYC